MKVMIVLAILFVVVAEASLVRRSNEVKDILSHESCKFLKNNGYLDMYEKLELLCLGTVGCNDSISTGCCKFLKAQNQCAGDLGKFCQLTCFKCGYVEPQGASPTVAATSRPQTSCKFQALGMESKAIPDSSITASSASIPPSNARLNIDGRGWQASRTRQGEWLQVDLGKLTMVLGIGTQGGSADYWVTSYTLKYSRDGKTFTDYESGKVLHGNSDGSREIIHELKPPIKARYIRVLPKTWNDKAMTLKMELYADQCK